jgi:hypothetical protein
MQNVMVSYKEICHTGQVHVMPELRHRKRGKKDVWWKKGQGGVRGSLRVLSLWAIAYIGRCYLRSRFT